MPRFEEDCFIADMQKWFSENPMSRDELKQNAKPGNIPSFPIMSGEEHPMYGKTHTEDAIAAIRYKRSLQKIVHSEETKQKIKIANQGKEKTEEHRRKLAIAQSKQKGKYTTERLHKMSEVSSGGKNHKAKQVRAEWKTGETKTYDCIKSFVLDTGINYESAKKLAKHGKFSRTRDVRLICL